MSLSSNFGIVGDLEPAYFNRRGAFHTGATISSKKDVVFYDASHGGDGNWYQYNGSAQLPMKVNAGDTPGSTWVNVGAASVYDLVRVQLANLDAALQQVAALASTVSNLDTNKQAKDATLTALANLTNAADQLAYFTGVDQMAVTAITSLARSLISKGNVADMQTVLGLGTAAVKNVGVGAGNIPDMSYFGVAGNGSAFSSIVIAGQKRIMEGTGSLTFNGGYSDFTLPLGYPSSTFTMIATDLGSAVASYATSNQSGTVVRIYGKDAAGNVISNGTSLGFKYIAMGPAS